MKGEHGTEKRWDILLEDDDYVFKSMLEILSDGMLEEVKWIKKYFFQANLSEDRTAHAKF